MHRSSNEKWISGVAAGFARFLGFRPIPFRLFLVLTIKSFYGLTVLLYLFLWVLLRSRTTSVDTVKEEGSVKVKKYVRIFLVGAVAFWLVGSGVGAATKWAKVRFPDETRRFHDGFYRIFRHGPAVCVPGQHDENPDREKVEKGS